MTKDQKDRDWDRSKFVSYGQGTTSPELELTVLMVLVSRRWRALLDEHLRPIDQSTARMEALAAIYASPPLSPQVEIAKRLRIEGPTLTRMLDALEKDSLVERLPDSNDRRTKLLRLTKRGEETLEEIFMICDGLRMKLVEGYSEAEIRAHSAFLRDLMGRVDRGLQA